MDKIQKLKEFKADKYIAVVKSLESFSIKEDYKDDLKTVIADEDSLYIIMKNDNIVIGMETLLDCSEKIRDMLVEDGILVDEDIKEDFTQSAKDLLESIDDYQTVSQDEIDFCLDKLLDKFDVVEPYRIVLRSELEEEPIDLSLVTDITESVDLTATDESGKEVVLDTFTDMQEANEYLPDFKSIYKEYTNFILK